MTDDVSGKVKFDENYSRYLVKVVDDEIASVRSRYADPTQADLLKGSVDGLEACRELDPKGLERLMKKANSTAQFCSARGDPEFRYWRARALEVEWVCNVVSAMLAVHRLPVIFHPTPKAALKASEVMGAMG